MWVKFIFIWRKLLQPKKNKNLKFAKKIISKMNKTIKITFIQWIFFYLWYFHGKIFVFSGWKNLVPPLTPTSTNGDHFCFQIKKFQHFLNDKWMNGKIEKLLFEVWFNEMKCIPPNHHGSMNFMWQWMAEKYYYHVLKQTKYD